MRLTTSHMSAVWIAFTLSVSLILGAHMPVHGTSSDVQAVALVDQGLEIAKTHPNSEEEARCYEKAVEIAPAYANAWFNLGMVRLQQSRERNEQGDTTLLCRRAAAAFERCIRHDPARTDAYYNSYLALSAIPAHPSSQGGEPDAILFPDLAALRLRQYLEVCAKKTNATSMDTINLERIVRRLEEQAARRNNAEILDFTSADQIVAKLTARPTRGASPYAAGRIPLRILFDHDKAEIRPDQIPQLREIAAALRDARLAAASIRIEGHTDSDGTVAYNQRLSERRAAVIRDFLVRKGGVTPERLISHGFGLSRPLKPNDTTKNKQMNRRVELVNETLERTFLAGETRGTSDPFYLFEPGKFSDYLETK